MQILKAAEKSWQNWQTEARREEVTCTPLPLLLNTLSGIKFHHWSLFLFSVHLPVFASAPLEWSGGVRSFDTCRFSSRTNRGRNYENSDYNFDCFTIKNQPSEVDRGRLHNKRKAVIFWHPRSSVEKQCLSLRFHQERAETFCWERYI